MKYNRYKCNSYNIYTINTDKFKTVRMEIVFSNKADKEKMPTFSFLCDILSDCSKKYPRRKDISIRLEELYKTVFYGTTNKVGSLFTISFATEFISPTYINEDNYLEEVLSFPFEIINNPLINNHEFDITNFNIVKRRTKEAIESIKESSDRLALLNSLIVMDEDSPSAYKVLGTINDLEKITPTNLYDAYIELFNHFNCDIFIIGDINMDKAAEIIKRNFKNRVIKLNKNELLVNNKLRKKPLIKHEKSTFIQSTLVMIYNISNLNNDFKNSAFHVFNYILGSGGISSKLYKKLRCDNSLCYGVRSLYLKYDSLLIIEVSLDKSNVEIAEKLIKESILDMINNDYTDSDLEEAKKNLIFSLKMGLDNNVSLLNNYVFNVYDDLPLSEERIDLINKVSKNDLLECAKSLSLNTIYVQDAGEEK